MRILQTYIMKTPSQITTSLIRTIRAYFKVRSRRGNEAESYESLGNPASSRRRLHSKWNFIAIVALGVALAMFQSAHAAMQPHWDFSTCGSVAISGLNVT